MTPLAQPAESYHKMLADWQGPKWENHFIALNTLRSIIKHHPDALQKSQLKPIIEHADSLRSGLAKLALKTLGEYVQVYDLTEMEIH